jgi:hypothetical protein
VVCPGVDCPEVDCPDIEPEVCPEVEPAPVPAVPELPVDPAVCNSAIVTGVAVGWRFLLVGPGAGEGVALPVAHWSATLVALVTLNSLVAPVEALEFIPEFPELAVAEVPEADALAFEPMPEPSCPVTCTSFPIRVRTAFKLPVNLYALPDLSVSV